MKLKPIVLVVLVVAALSATATAWVRHSATPIDCADSHHRMAKMQTKLIKLLDSKGKILPLQVHLADDNEKRANGYQYICKSVIDETIILFLYPVAIQARFHMRNVKTPLDIGFFDSNGLLITSMLMQTYVDGNNQLYSPGVPFQYALEAKPGFFKSHNLLDSKSRLVLASLN